MHYLQGPFEEKKVWKMKWLKKEEVKDKCRCHWMDVRMDVGMDGSERMDG